MNYVIEVVINDEQLKDQSESDQRRNVRNPVELLFVHFSIISPHLQATVSEKN